MVGPIVLALIKEYHNAGESIFLREEIRRGFLLLPGKQGAEFWGGGLRQIGAPMELPVGATPHGEGEPGGLPFLILWRVNPLVIGNKKTLCIFYSCRCWPISFGSAAARLACCS